MKRILVIDDDELLRGVILKGLRRNGFEVLDAANGRHGTDLARTYSPDLILCDVHLPDDDGYGILQAMRSDVRTALIPVILMTGQADKIGMRRGMEAGADDYLPKPFSMEALLAAVQARLLKLENQRQREEQSKARLLAILEATTDLVAILDPRSLHLSYLNRAGRKMLGIEPTENLSQCELSDLHPAWALQQVKAEGIPAAVHHGVWNGETAFRTRAGAELTVSQLILAHQAPGGGLEYLSTIARDITGAKQAQEALRRSEELFRVITENAVDLIAVVGIDGRRLYNSPSYQRVLGYSSDELLATPAYEHVHREDLPKVMAAARQARDTGSSSVIEYRMRHKDGSWRTLESHAGGVRNAAGEIETLVIVARDITTRKQAEQEHQRTEIQLRHAQKMESIGQLAAGIAHEINTPTQYIGDNLHFLRDTFRDLVRLLSDHERLLRAARANTLTPDLLSEVETTLRDADTAYLITEIPQAIEQSLEGVKRVTTIVRAMKDFSHPGGEGKTPVDLNQAIQTTITVARNEWKYVAEVVTDFDPALPPVPCLPGEINQVILNLVINAAHAIADVLGEDKQSKGTITISTRAAGEWVEIGVADTGSGIPAHVRDRVFDPFFTTKPAGKGTGQGLAIAHSVVVDKHNGRIDFETEPGRGTRFRVCLPLHPPGLREDVSAA